MMMITSTNGADRQSDDAQDEPGLGHACTLQRRILADLGLGLEAEDDRQHRAHQRADDEPGDAEYERGHRQALGSSGGAVGVRLLPIRLGRWVPGRIGRFAHGRKP